MDFIETIDSNREKFLRYNSLKYQRFQQLVTNVAIKRVLNSIPFLLCVNNQKLPGYVAGDVPLGVCNYTPDEETKRYLRGKFPAAKMGTHNYKPFVEMVAVMGSVGTVAYNKKSDFDYWVCVNKRDVSSQQFEKFREKVDAIQRWVAREIGVPVHLFVNDVESVKQNIFAEDEEEAFGSTVGAVLKDEFFRSSTVIAGKIPFWWVLPQFVRDSEYSSLYERLPQSQKDHYVDLGNLYEISREDFLGAALFQIIKSLGNPFKSIIKIGVLEKYIFGKGDSPLLSQKIKINILRDNFDNTIIDSYLMMFREVYEYYATVLDDMELINILTQNLYLKVDPQISKYAGIKDKKNIPYKVHVMAQYVREWGWDIETIRDLDRFDEWDYNRVKIFWDSVKKFMLLSYQKIVAHFPSLRLEKKIPESDFMLLSRKIKTHFSSEKDKIDQFITFRDTRSEAILYIEPVSQGVHDFEWRLYKRAKSENDSFITTTLRVENNLLRLLLWMSLNQIYNPVFSRLNIQSGYTRINQTLVTELLNQVGGLFTGDRIAVKNEYYLHPSFTLLNMVIVNFNKENAEKIESLQHLYYTSWGESYLHDYGSEDDVARILHTVLKDGCTLKKPFDEYCIVNSPEPFKKMYKRIASIFKESYSFLIENRSMSSARFITQIGEKYICATRDENGIAVALYPNLVKMLIAMTLKAKPAMAYSFYNDEGPITYLEMLYRLRRPHAITIVSEEKNEHLVVYVINEKGNLFVFYKNRKAKDQILMTMYDFCRNVIKRVNENNSAAGIGENSIKFYSIKSDRAEKISFLDESEAVQKMYLANFKAPHALVVSVSHKMGDETFYNVVFPDNVSSGFMTMKESYSIAEKVRELRLKGYETFCLVRDLVLDSTMSEDAEWGTSQYFLEKYRIEFIMDR